MVNIHEIAKKAGTTVCDFIFKTSILVLLAVFLFLYYQNSQVGRYYFHNEKETGAVMVMDSATGSIYIPAIMSKPWGEVFTQGWTDGRDKRFFWGKRKP